MFTKDSVVLFELVQLSREGVCFVETYSNESIPMKDVEVVEVGDSIWLRGLDAFNNLENEIFALTIKGFTGIDNRDHFIVRKRKSEYDNLLELCEEENIKVKKEFLYKEIPVYQRAISLCMDKHYEDISLQELKTFWKQSIEKYCLAFEANITNEVKPEDIALHSEELEAIRAMFTDIKRHEEVNSFVTKDEVVKYWPVLLMPAPLYVKPEFE